MQITNDPKIKKENVKCSRCNRHTFQQIDDRKILMIGDKKFEPIICSGCLKPIEYCICEDWIQN